MRKVPEKFLLRDFFCTTGSSSIPNLISRRQFNDRRELVSGLCEQIRSRIANHIDGGEDYFCIDSKPIEVCRVARDAGVEKLLLGHYSARYNDENLLLEEARAIFPNAQLSQEGMIIEL